MALRSTRLLRFSVFGGMTVTMLIGMVAGFWPLIAANRQMAAFCAAQAVGTPLARLQAQAAERGYAVVQTAPGAVQVDDPAGFGRRQCQLPLDGQGRVSGPPAP